MRASGAQGLANNARGISINAYGLPVAWRGFQRRRDHGPPQGREDTVRAQLGAAESPPPPKSRHQQQGGALATAMLVGRMLLLDNSNDRAQMLDVGNVIMIMHG